MSCCGCVSIKTGIVVIGVLSLFWDLLCGCYGIVLVDLFADSVSRHGWSRHGLDVMVGAIILTSGIIGVTTSCSLLYGVRTRSPRLIKPWIIGSSIGIGLMLTATIIVMFEGGYEYGINTLELIVKACFILVVRRYNVQLEEELAEEGGHNLV
jgi:hypothetical protein